MQKAQIITFSAPARYAEILKAMPNKSAFIVEALDRQLIARNYRTKNTVTKTSKKTTKPKKHVNTVLMRHIEAFRKSLPKDKRTITVEEILKYKNEGRA